MHHLEVDCKASLTTIHKLASLGFIKNYSLTMCFLHKGQGLFIPTWLEFANQHPKITPCDRSLHAQPISIRISHHVIGVCLSSQSASEKHNQGKKPTYLCAPRKFLKNICRQCLIITQCCYFDCRINKPLTCSELAAWSALFTWSRRITHAKDHGLFKP